MEIGSMSGYEFQNSFNTLALNEVPDPDIAGGELERIRQKHDGELRPEDVVTEARKRRNPLRKCFEWDDTKAGHLHRITQAQQLIKSVRVIPAPGSAGHKAYTSVRTAGTNKRHYGRTKDLMVREETREEILMDCLSQLVRWRRRWHELNEIADAVGDVDKAIKRLQKKTATACKD